MSPANIYKAVYADSVAKIQHQFNTQVWPSRAKYSVAFEDAFSGVPEMPPVEAHVGAERNEKGAVTLPWVHQHLLCPELEALGETYPALGMSVQVLSFKPLKIGALLIEKDAGAQRHGYCQAKKVLGGAKNAWLCSEAVKSLKPNVPRIEKRFNQFLEMPLGQQNFSTLKCAPVPNSTGGGSSTFLWEVQPEETFVKEVEELGGFLEFKESPFICV